MEKVFIAIVIIGLSANISYGTSYWVKTYERGYSDGAFSIQKTSDGGYIIPCNTMLIKTNADGNVEWAKDKGGEYVQQTSDGGYVVVRTCGGCTGGEEAFGVMKLDSSGNVTWQKAYGRLFRDYPHCIQQTSDSGYIVGGDGISDGVRRWDILILKLDSIGNIIWQKAYGENMNNYFGSIQQTSDGGYIVGGETRNHEEYAWVLKLDSSGNVTWQKTYGGPRIQSIQQTSDGGYILLSSNLIKINADGNVEWATTLEGFHDRNSVQQTTDGGYVIAGNTQSFGAGLGDACIMKLDSSRNITWQKTYGGSDHDFATSIQQTTDGEYVVVGMTDSFGLEDNRVVWMLRLDSSGEIPDCDIMENSDVILNDAEVTPQGTNAVIEIPSFTITDTSITPKDISPEISAICCDDTDVYDCDQILYEDDNCPYDYNPWQEDTYPPQKNNCGDACECEGNFDGDADVDGTDAATFKADFGRGAFQRPCTNADPCNGDFNCDGDVDGTDASLFKSDFGRSSFSNPCPACVAGVQWCQYP